MMSTSKIVLLKSFDGETFEVEEAVALKSRTIAHMVEDDCTDNGIPLANVTAVILAKVIEYCKKHVVVPNGDDDSSSSSNDELKNWDTTFMNSIDESTLFQLISAANFLDIKDVLELTCQTVVDMIKDKTVEEVRTLFNIENDFTPEEEAEIRAEYQWAFE